MAHCRTWPGLLEVAGNAKPLAWLDVTAGFWLSCPAKSKPPVDVLRCAGRGITLRVSSLSVAHAGPEAKAMIDPAIVTDARP
jgi:hypothetical protein